jgi:hypothetical protein
MPTYRQILKTAWQIAKNNPVLWLFGFFVSVISGGGEIEILIRSVDLGSTSGVASALITGFIQGGALRGEILADLPKLLITRPFFIFMMLLMFLVAFWIIIFGVWLVVVSQSALIKGVIDFVKNKKPSWRNGWHFGKEKFWPVLGLNAIEKAIVWVSFTVLGFMGYQQAVIFELPFIITFWILVPVIVIVAFIVKYAICGVILKNYNFKDAVRSALDLFYKNWLVSLEVALLMFVIYFVIELVLALVLSSVFVYTLKLLFFYTYAPIVAYLVTFLIFAVVESIVAVFYWVTWVLVFEILSNKKVVASSRITGAFKRIFG